jgi:phage/conjugal plasmid C-4 type zinc finger TraR family protein
MNQEERLEQATARLQQATEQRVAAICERLPKGESRTHCSDCGSPIPEARRAALAGVQRCIDCQEHADRWS